MHHNVRPANEPVEWLATRRYYPRVRHSFSYSRMWARMVFVAAALVGCSDGSEPQDAPPAGLVQDEQTLIIGGGEEQTITLGKTGTKVEVVFPPEAVPQRTRLTVRLESEVNKRGATPAGVGALHVATQSVRLDPPARMRQEVPVPPPGRRYVAVTALPDIDSWTIGPVARVAGPPATMQVFEIDIGGTGLWAIALVDATGDGGVDSAPANDGAREVSLRDDPAPATDGARDGIDASATRDAGVQDGGPWDVTAGDIAALAPQLAMLSPISGVAGKAVTLTVTGQNFALDAQVMFGGLRLTTLRVSDTSLQADVPSSNTQQAGQYAVWVENGNSATAPRSNVIYFTVNPPLGAPVIVDYTPDNGEPGQTIRILGNNLAGTGLTITDSRGVAATPGATGTIAWWNGTLETVAIVLPQEWHTGPITVAHDKGSYRGKIFNVGKNLATLAGAVGKGSTDYSASWPSSKGFDNDLSTSWFSRIGDCAGAPAPTCTTVPWYRLNFPSPQTIARIAKRGNREYESGYDFIRGKFEVLGPNDIVLWGASYDLPDPDRDLDIALTVPVTGAMAVKFTSEKDDPPEPGLAELEAFGP